MNIYEFITPSDPITFKADNDKVAYYCALLLGKGKAGCTKFESTGEQTSIPTLLLFSSNPEKDIKDFIGEELDSFTEVNKPEIKACFESFAYGDIESRRTFDDAISSISDPVKLKDFKAKHEDRNRTSLSGWVKAAWSYADRLQ